MAKRRNSRNNSRNNSRQIELAKIPGSALIDADGLHCFDELNRATNQTTPIQIDPKQIYGGIGSWNKQYWEKNNVWDKYPTRYLLKCAETDKATVETYKKLWEEKYSRYYSLLPNNASIKITEDNKISIDTSTQLNLNDQKNKEALKRPQRTRGCSRN